MTTNLKEEERLDDLQVNGYEIIQHPGKFCFGMDAVLLSNFARVKKGECALDLGTGTGIIPILLTAKTEGERFVGLEIQDESADTYRIGIYSPACRKICQTAFPREFQRDTRHSVSCRISVSRSHRQSRVGLPQPPSISRGGACI